MTDISGINYQPLGGMKNAWHQVIKASFRGYGWIVGGLIVAVGIGLLVFAGAGVLVLIGYATYIGWLLQKYEDSIWRSFAAANRWNIVSKAETKNLVPPTLQTAGNRRRNSETVSGTLGRIPFNIFWYEFTIGSGKSSHSFDLTVISLQINATLPHMFLRASKALTVGDTSKLKEKLRLEGDFNKYFKVFVQPDLEVDDLVILTPDVMQFLISQDPAYNIELSTSTIYIIADNDLRQPDKLPGLLDFSQKIYAQVLQNLPMAQASNAQVPQAQQSS